MQFTYEKVYSKSFGSFFKGRRGTSPMEGTSLLSNCSISSLKCSGGWNGDSASGTHLGLCVCGIMGVLQRTNTDIG